MFSSFLYTYLVTIESILKAINLLPPIHVTCLKYPELGDFLYTLSWDNVLNSAYVIVNNLYKEIAFFQYAVCSLFPSSATNPICANLQH